VGNFSESGTKFAGVKGSKDADGDNVESDDGREVSLLQELKKESWTTFGGWSSSYCSLHQSWRE